MRNSHLLIIGITLLYLVFPTQNSWIDAWAYASDAKWGHDLFRPHHLLFSAFFHGIFLLVKWTGIEALTLIKVVNALATGGSLWLAHQILVLRYGPQTHTFTRILAAGACFVTLRFATEGEVYALPLFFSMVGTYKYYLAKKTHTMLGYFTAGAWMVLACLFHQIHIWWWLAFVGYQLGYRQFQKSMLLISAGLFIIPAYLLGWYFTPQAETFWGYVLQDAMNGQVALVPGWDNFKFLFINLLRSVIQIHGNLLALIGGYAVIQVFAGIALIGMMFFGRWWFIKLWRKIEFKGPESWAFLAHLLFAWYSVGNAEFMMMLPFLAILMQHERKISAEKKYNLFYASILLWNMSVAIVPSSWLDYHGSKALAKQITERKNSTFWVEEADLMLNMIDYQLGEDAYQKYKSNTIHSLHQITPNNIDHQVEAWDSLGQRGIKTYLIVSQGLSRAWSRKGMTIKNEEVWNNLPSYRWSKVWEHAHVEGETVLYEWVYQPSSPLRGTNLNAPKDSSLRP